MTLGKWVDISAPLCFSTEGWSGASVLKHVTCLVDTMGTAYMLSSLLFSSAPGDRLKWSLYKTKMRLKKKKLKKEKTTALKFWLPNSWILHSRSCGHVQNSLGYPWIGVPSPRWGRQGWTLYSLGSTEANFPLCKCPTPPSTTLILLLSWMLMSAVQNTIHTLAKITFCISSDTEMYGLSFWVETHILWRSAYVIFFSE